MRAHPRGGIVVVALVGPRRPGQGTQAQRRRRLPFCRPDILVKCRAPFRLIEVSGHRIRRLVWIYVAFGSTLGTRGIRQ